MKSCDQFAELLPALAEDVLAPAEAQDVRAHLATCAACAESWKVQEVISRHFRETDLAEKPDYFWARQRKHILQEVGLGTSRFEKADAPRRRLGFALAAVAAALLVVGTVALLRKPTPSDTNGGGVARDPKPAPVKETPIVKDVPEKAPDAPEPPEKKDEVAENPTPNEPIPQPPHEPVVRDPEKPLPAPGDVPKGKPKEEIVKGPPKDKPAPPKTTDLPNPPPVEAKPEAVAIIPGHARYSARLAQEQVDILLPLDDMKLPVLKARDTSEQALAVLKSARGRIEDIRAMQAKDPKADIVEMVDAYAHLVGEGAAPIILRIGSDPSRTLGASLRAELRAHQAALDAFPDDLKKGTLSPALQACAAANNLRVRRHPRSAKGPESGAWSAARESVMFLTAPGSGTMTIVLRNRWGMAFSNRYQVEMLEHARHGRLPEAEGDYEAYQRIADGVVRMLEWLDPKDAVRVCGETKRDLNSNIARFNSSRPADAAKGLVIAAVKWTADLIIRVNAFEMWLTGKMPKPEKKDTPPPSTPPSPPAGTPPAPTPPFGEPPPPPSPPPPPPPPFGEQDTPK